MHPRWICGGISVTHLTLGSTSVLVDVAIEGRRRVDATEGRRFETPESLTDAVGGGFADLVEVCETLCFLPRPNIFVCDVLFFFFLFPSKCAVQRSRL